MAPDPVPVKLLLLFQFFSGLQWCNLVRDARTWPGVATVGVDGPLVCELINCGHGNLVWRA